MDSLNDLPVNQKPGMFDALIIGSGPTGMTLAIELRRAGLNVRIVDKSGYPALHSQALVIQARTLEQLQRYGLAEQVVSLGRKLTHANMWSDGKQIVSIDFSQIPSRYPYLLFLPQNETETILNQHMESLGIKIERLTELVSFSQHSDSIAATLRHHGGALEQVTARWLIGCDGAHSLVREQSQIPFEGGGIGLSFFLGDLELEGPDAPDNNLAIHLHKGNVVFMGRLSDKLVRIIVALHQDQNQQQHAKPLQNGQPELTIQDFQRAIDQSNVKVTVRSADWMTPFYVNDKQARSYRQGNVFLAGDASHIHSPVGGQGMNTGMQDAANLGWKLAAVAHGADPALLDSYHEEREAVGKALLDSTERGLKMATTANPFLESIRDTVAPIATRWTVVQKDVLGFISETAINYRHSSITADHGGDGSLRAGDRMPDINVSLDDRPTPLLDHWTDGHPRLLLLNATEHEQAELKSQFSTNPTHVILLDGSRLDDDGRELLGADPKILFLRPDGYIGFRAPIAKSSEIANYLKRIGTTA